MNGSPFTAAAATEAGRSATHGPVTRRDRHLTRRAAAEAAGSADRMTGGTVWLYALTVISAFGLLLMAVADAGARAGSSWADPLFWTALLVIVLPVAYRLLSGEPDRRERLLLVGLLAISTYLVKVLHTPTGFDLHDELGQARSTMDVLRSGHLFSANPIVADYAYYPGLLSITAALSRLTGLSVFVSGLIVIGLARCLLLVGLFAVMENVTKSARVAGVATILYAANPNFLFFDAQFAYESLALALAILALWMCSHTLGRRRPTLGDGALVLGVTAATVLTHHLTSYALCLTMIGWVVVQHFLRPEPSVLRRRWLGAIAVLTAAATGAWGWFAFAPTQQDIGNSISKSISGLIAVITGSVATKAPFTSAPGYADSSLAEVIGLVSVVLLVGALPFGLRAAWKARRSHPLVTVLGLVAAAYPVTLAVRLTAAGTETSNRTSEFLFIALAAVIGLALVRWLGRRIDDHPVRGRLLQGLCAAAIATAIVGGLIVGWAPYSRLPGRYLVEGDTRSVDTLDVDAAKWAGRRLPADSPILTDIDTELLMAAYGNLDPQAGTVNGVPVDDVFLARTFTATQRQLLRYDRIRYLVVDDRLATAPPATGQFFRNADRTDEALPRQSLAKFDGVRGLSRIFDSGPIQVYDGARLLQGQS